MKLTLKAYNKAYDDIRNTYGLQLGKIERYDRCEREFDFDKITIIDNVIMIDDIYFSLMEFEFEEIETYISVLKFNDTKDGFEYLSCIESTDVRNQSQLALAIISKYLTFTN